MSRPLVSAVRGSQNCVGSAVAISERLMILVCRLARYPASPLVLWPERSTRRIVSAMGCVWPVKIRSELRQSPRLARMGKAQGAISQ